MITINDQPVDVYTLADDPAMAYIDPAVFPTAILLSALGNLMQACNAAVPRENSPGPGGQWATIQFGSEPGQYPGLAQLVYPDGDGMLNPDLHPCLFGHHGSLTIGSQTWDANIHALWDYLHRNYAGVVGDTPGVVFTGSVRIPVTADATVVNGNLAQWVILGSPFASDCGDGVTRVLFDNSFNGMFRGMQDFTPRTGHVDLIPPAGCNALAYDGEVVAPIEGTITPSNTAYFITLPPYTYLLGIERVFSNAGVPAFSLNNVQSISLNIAHFTPIPTIGSTVFKGQTIGDIAPDTGHANPIKLAFQINIMYDLREYMFSPTRFLEAANQEPWPCITVDPPYACNPIYNNYP
ncbi:MAG TPA: hypothetical protein VLM83_13170 [Anaerolineales bacterium]|nr:hypothetical protein [Anaerolineales bacterium]